MRIYVASSWRNPRVDQVVQVLRDAGHDVYNFKEHGFGWLQLAAGDPKTWTPARFRELLEHPRAIEGFHSDLAALNGCEACVLVLPCGRSAHLELGLAVGNCSFTAVLLDDPLSEPELMYRMCDAICLSVEEIVQVLAKYEAGEGFSEPPAFGHVITPDPDGEFSTGDTP
jgi:hypothetical protein